MKKINCIWNRDLDNFPNCCIWAYKVCTPEGCESIEEETLYPKVPRIKCIECDEDERLG